MLYRKQGLGVLCECMPFGLVALLVGLIGTV